MSSGMPHEQPEYEAIDPLFLATLEFDDAKRNYFLASQDLVNQTDMRLAPNVIEAVAHLDLALVDVFRCVLTDENMTSSVQAQVVATFMLRENEERADRLKGMLPRGGFNPLHPTYEETVTSVTKLLVLNAAAESLVGALVVKFHNDLSVDTNRLFDATKRTPRYFWTVATRKTSEYTPSLVKAGAIFAIGSLVTRHLRRK